MKLILCVLTLAVAQKAAAETETWKCKEFLFGDEDLVTLTADFEAGIGSVIASGLPERATFTLISGFERVWTWECTSGQRYPECQFNIKVDGKGGLYEFAKGENTTKPSDIFSCRQVSGE